jgi:cytochrome c oxidase assembly factor CtaG
LAAVLGAAPPISIEARRYVFVGDIQFALFALAVPALLALGDLLSFSPARWQKTVTRVAARRAASRRSRRGLPAALARVVLFVVAVALWRAPFAVDGLVHIPALLIAEAATFALVGSALWSEIIPTKLGLRLNSAQRIVPAAVAMWLVWILAYFVGFSRSKWYPAVSHVGSPLSVVADQELGTGVLWATAAIAFVPVVFANLMRFLRGSEEVDEELERILGSGSSEERLR